MEKFYKKFTSRKELIRQIAMLSDKFDEEKMLELIKKGSRKRMYLVTEDKVHICESIKKFIAVANWIGDLDFIKHQCFGRGEVYHIFSRTDYFNTKTEKEDVIVEDVTQEAVVVEEEVLINTEEIISKPSLNLEHIESMYDENDKRGSKDKLETYAKETFGVDLNKRLKFEGMVDELTSLVDKD